MVRLGLVTALLLVACKGNESPSRQPMSKAPTPTSQVGMAPARGTLKRRTVETTYGVAVPAGSNMAALEKLAREAAPNLVVTRASLADLFDGKQLALLTKSLSASDVDGLESSLGVIVLRGAGDDGVKLAREIGRVTRDVADAAHGWVLDPETFQIFPAAAFHDHVLGEHPDARKLIVVRNVVGGNEQPWLDTAGLHRYGFPELYVSEAATGQLNQITHLINGAAQALLDGEDVNDRGEIAIDFHKLGWNVGNIQAGRGKAVWRTRWAKERDAGADDDLVLELLPPSGVGAEGASMLIGECFGREPEEIAELGDSDADLMVAAEKARADLVNLGPHFAKGIPIDERLTVKARFTDDKGHTEWMWIDVVAFAGDSFGGTLANAPALIRSLHAGQKVTAKLADVGDYLLEKKGGGRVGGYSIEVMEKRGLCPVEGRSPP